MELPWSATLPISPALRSQWQSLLDKNDVIGAVNLFPTIWNSLRVSCSWIVNNQLPKKNKGSIKYDSYYMNHFTWLINIQRWQKFEPSFKTLLTWWIVSNQRSFLHLHHVSSNRAHTRNWTWKFWPCPNLLISSHYQTITWETVLSWLMLKMLKR